MNTLQPSDIVFTEAVKAAQEKRGSREMYARVEGGGGLPSEIDDRMQAMSDQIQALRKENRSLKQQLSKSNK